MSCFLKIFNTTPREEELQSRIDKLEDGLEELNYELGEDLERVLCRLSEERVSNK